MKEHLIQTKLGISILKIMNKEAVDQFAIYYLISEKAKSSEFHCLCWDGCINAWDECNFGV